MGGELYKEVYCHHEELVSSGQHRRRGDISIAADFHEKRDRAPNVYAAAIFPAE